MADFRFQELEIWQLSIEISDKLFDIADKTDKLKLYRFAEQLRASVMSISNNIAEGSGSFSNKEFSQFLNISRRSVYECANILLIKKNTMKVKYDKENDIIYFIFTLCR